MKKRFLFILCFTLFFASVAVCKAETLEIGQTLTLTASDAPTSYSPMGTVSRTHSWYTEDSSVVEIVSRNGYTCTVRAKSSGTTKITNKQSLMYSTYNAALGILSRSESGFGGVWTITVPAIDPTGISLPSTISVEAEAAQSITPTYTPLNASSELTWTSSNTNIATVDNGKICGINPGTAKITVKTANGYSAVCTVTVTAPDTVLEDIYPIDGENNVSVNTDIRFMYNMGISGGSTFSSIKLYDNTVKSTVSITKKTEGKSLIIMPENPLLQGHSYTATVPPNAVKNSYGTKNSAEVSTTFKVSALCMTNTVPAMNETDVAVDTSVSITFDGKIESGTNRNGITLKDENGNNVSFGKAFSNNTLIITPKTNLEYLAQYTLTVSKGAVACDGADSEADVTLTFKTIRDSNKVYPPEFVFENGKIIITAEENASVYYTLDGGIPLVSGTLYGEPVELRTKNIHIRAIAQKNGKISAESEYIGTAETLNDLITSTSISGDFRTVTVTEDGYIMAGSLDSDDIGNGDWAGVGANGQDDAIIVKCNADGSVKWKKNFGGNGNDCFEGIIAMSDGYVAVGYSTVASFGNGDWAGVGTKGKSDAIIVKYDTDGNAVWKKSFGGSGYASFSGIAVTSDGYVAIGYSYSGSFETGDLKDNVGNGYEDAVIVKYDIDGNVVWKKNFGGGREDYFQGVTAVNDGYIVVGYSYSNGFGRGDWKDSVGNGEADAIIVKYDTGGNVEWKKNFGGIGNDCFESVAAIQDGYVAVGRSYENSFGTGDWMGEVGNGYWDAVIVKYDTDGNVKWKNKYGGSESEGFYGATATENAYIAAGSDTLMISSFWECAFDSDRYISSESGKAAVSGKSVVVKGDEITVPVYFTPNTDVTGVNIKLTYPTGLTYLGCSTDYDCVYADNTSGSVTLSGDFSSDDAHIVSNDLCVLVRLKFKVNSELDNGSYVVSIDDAETFMLDLNYVVKEFDQTHNYEFSVSDMVPKEVTIIGNKEITTSTQYEVAVFPENTVAQGFSWSVSDESIAKVDQNGLLTPLKNGKVTLTVKETSSGLENSIDVVILEIRTYIDEILSDTGNFAKAYAPSETERVLYVPRGTDNLKLTFDYGAGSVSYDGGIFFKNVARTISITDFPFELTVVKNESGCENTTYIIKILEKETAEIVPNIDKNNNTANIDIMVNTDIKANLIIAVYDKNTLKSVISRECHTGENNIATDMELSGDKIKIMLFEYGGMKPLCDAYEMNY